MSKPKAYTVADIIEKQGVSERTAIRRMAGVKPAYSITGFNGRKVRAWSRAQVAAAFAKVKA